MTQTFTLYRVKCSYQVRFCLLQAAHYGTPQTRVRFYLFGAQRGYPLFAAPKPTHDFPQMHGLEIRFPNDDIVLPVRAEAGTAPFKFVTIDDAISDLPRFDWCESSHFHCSLLHRPLR
jgi:DNA (cytosine-5)-methyltransferase 1